MSAKVHLLSCSEPHQDGSTVRVACGIELPNATAIRSRDDIAGVGDVSFPSTCRECNRAGFGNSKRYYYALVSGEESKQMEAKRGNS